MAVYLDKQRQRLTSGELSARLSAVQFAILRTLFEAEGVAVSAERMAYAVWGWQQPASPRDSTRVAVAKLRRKLEAAGLPDVIATNWGAGYSLRTDVTADACPCCGRPLP